MKNKKIKTETIKLDKFEVIYIESSPPRLESKIEFDKNHISQKLIFTLMEISHYHGFGCSPPYFGSLKDQTMTFLIGTVANGKRGMKKQLEAMHSCLSDVFTFVEAFNKQLDFSKLDLSMFEGIMIGDVEKIAAVRDQHYNGSWKELYDKLIQDGYPDAAEVAVRLKQFEDLNNKDIGLIGHKLNYVLDSLYSKEEKNTVLN